MTRLWRKSMPRPTPDNRESAKDCVPCTGGTSLGGTGDSPVVVGDPPTTARPASPVTLAASLTSAPAVPNATSQEQNPRGLAACQQAGWVSGARGRPSVPLVLASFITQSCVSLFAQTRPHREFPSSGLGRRLRNLGAVMAAALRNPPSKQTRVTSAYRSRRGPVHWPK